MDFNLFGMNHIRLASARFRPPLPQTPFPTRKGWDIEGEDPGACGMDGSNQQSDPAQPQPPQPPQQGTPPSSLGPDGSGGDGVKVGYSLRSGSQKSQPPRIWTDRTVPDEMRWDGKGARGLRCGGEVLTCA
eukprot:484140-Pelagomonas_calceolata.AAC.10